MSLKEKLRARGIARFAARPADEQGRIRDFFEQHPESRHAYLLFDGRIIDERRYQRQATSRTAQLLAIATDGFPELISRAIAEAR